MDTTDRGVAISMLLNASAPRVGVAAADVGGGGQVDARERDGGRGG